MRTPAGRPFVGRAGQLLTKIIEAMRWRRDEVYITNVVKCRPPDNRTPLPAEVEKCSPYLLRQIELIRPKRHRDLGKGGDGLLHPRPEEHGGTKGSVRRSPGHQDHADLPSFLCRPQRRQPGNQEDGLAGYADGDGIPWQEVTVFAEVVFPLPVDRSFHYGIPEALRPAIKPGCRIVAPFGRRMMTGFVVAVVEGKPAAAFELKDISEVLDKTPSFSPGFLRFTKKLSARSFSPWGEVLAAALPPTLVPKDRTKVLLTAAGREALEKGSLGKRERKLASFLPRGRGLSPAFLAKKMEVRSLSSLILRMETEGLLSVRTVPSRRGKQILAAGPGRTSRQLELDFVRTGRRPRLRSTSWIRAGGSGSFYLFGSREAREAAYAGLIRSSFGARGRVLYLAPGDRSQRGGSYPPEGDSGGPGSRPSQPAFEDPARGRMEKACRGPGGSGRRDALGPPGPSFGPSTDHRR